MLFRSVPRGAAPCGVRRLGQTPFVPLVASSGFAGAVGNTPLIKLNRLSEETGRNIWAKAEYMNPGGSVKDRAALFFVLDAERRGLLGPGGTVVEGTAGNTGIGLAHIARARGYRCVIYMPNTQLPQKMETLRMLGAEVHPVPVVAFTDPANFNHQAARHAEALPNAVWTNQFDLLVNRDAHIATTGPEIWAQLDGKVDGFTCSTGTGGTFAGITSYLKRMLKGKTVCVVADPPGLCVHLYVQLGGKLLERTGGSFTEGIGQGRITANLATEIDNVDGLLRVEDAASLLMVYRLLDEEGLYIGGTGALNVHAAAEVAKTLPPDSNVVTLLADSAHKYAEKYFSRSWLESKGFWDELPEHLRHYAVLA